MSPLVIVQASKTVISTASRGHVARLVACVFAALGTVSLAARDVVISEIQYHPHGDRRENEFLELENRGDETADLSGWALVAGVIFVFPGGTVLEPGEALVVSPDRDTTIARYGIDPERVVGSYDRRLDNDGEVLHLIDGGGRTAFRVHYRDGAGWPSLPDGNGPSLELLPGFWDPDLADSWRTSPAPAGTPGEPTRDDAGGPGGRDLLGPGAVWKYFEGREEPSPGDPLAWTRAGFDDGAWLEGAEPLGFREDDLFGTDLSPMWGAFVSVYARLRFHLSEVELELIESGRARLEVSITFDDGFVAYLNGSERLRENADGAPGEPVPFDAGASRSESSSRSFALGGMGGGADGRLLAGDNLLALHGLNRSPFSSDFALGAVVRLTTDRTRAPPIRINEVKPSQDGSPGFLELYNPSSHPADLSGLGLTDDPWAGVRHAIPAATTLPPRGFAVFVESELFPLRRERRVFLLLDREGVVLDAFAAEPGAAGRSAIRLPDGSDDRFSTSTPTPGAPNAFDPDDRVVINEIHYHPADTETAESAALEYIELANRTGLPVPLDGWRLTEAVDFDFPDGTFIEGGGFLLVAADPEVLAAEYAPPSPVVGPWLGRLANDEERITLRDGRNNVADRVRYADDGSWPLEADGSGPSAELIHPDLDNAFGAAWEAGPAGGTPGLPNESFRVAILPRVVAVHHEPVVPGPTDEVTVSCRVVDNGPVDRLILSWENDNQGGSGAEEMNDSGAGADEAAGDGLWSASIPPQPSDATVRFEITAEDGAGSRTVPGDGRFFLYEVNPSPFVRSDVPHYTILMTQSNWREIRTRGNRSDDLLDGTFVDHQQGRAWYNVGIRYRGNGTRNPPDDRFNYRVDFADDDKFQGLKRLNFNSQNTHRQYLGNDLFRRAGLPYPVTVPVVLRFDATVDARYVRLEAYDEDFLNRYFGGDDEGNLYRGLSGRLDFRGEDPAEYEGRYRKVTNEEENDFTDLIELTRALAIDDEDVFSAEVEERVDVREWILYFAAQGAMGNRENSINLDAGDDYFLYSRPSDGRFLILPWDSDTVFVEADQRLFRPSSGAVSRLLRHPRYAPEYYCALNELQDGYMSIEEIGRALARISTIHVPEDLDGVRDFLPARHDFLDRAIPRALRIDDAPGSGTVLIAPGDDWAFRAGTSDPSGGDLSWTLPGFDDGDWPVGPSGFGYGDGDDATTFDDMRDNYSTVFVRRTFRLDDPSLIASMTLGVDYDDGFVAYLNGAEIARRNYDGAIPRAADTASEDREAGRVEEFPLDDDMMENLTDGDNVLAMVALNGTLDSSDLSLIPSLEAVFHNPAAGCDDLIFTPQEEIRLSGWAPSCETRRVTVNGLEADYVPAEARWSITLDLAPGANLLDLRAMDTFGAPVARETFTVQRSSGIRELPVAIPADLHLEPGDGPFRLRGETVVGRDARLTVDAGTLVLVDPGARLVVRGLLQVSGTAGEPVIFRPSRCGLSWSGVVLEGTAGGTHLIRGCELLSGDPSEEGLVQVNDARVEIRDSRFAGGRGYAIAALRGDVLVEGAEVLSNERGVFSSDSTLRVVGTRLEGISGDGVVADGGAVSLESSRISAGGAGFRASGGGHEVAGTLLWRSGAGIAASAGAVVRGDHDTIADAAIGLEADGEGTEVLLSSSIVWRNGAGASATAGAAVSFEYSDVQDGVPAGAGNISADPLFVSPATGGYELSPGSPAAGTGKDGTDMGAFPAPSAAAVFIRGDSDLSGTVNLTDAIQTLRWLFQGGGPVACPDAADTDDDGAINLTDAVVTLRFLFQGGPPPSPPFPEPGIDPTGDLLDCAP